MKALKQEVLLGALGVQDELLGPTMHFNPRRERNDLQVWDAVSNLTTEVRDSMHAINGLGNNSWFFHSPLLYWSCSEKAILEDGDITATVNAQSRQVTSVNITLRHSIVFSGKRFEDHRLVAADALVITLLHKLDSPVGRAWEGKTEALTKKRDGKWRFYPPDGRVAVSQLYEFKFQPLSLQDDIILGTAYVLAVVYFLFSLTKLRAVESRLGLTVTVIAQIAVSIMSSFTICAVFKIDLSKIPREAYPLVVLTIGLENMFRLINAVIITPSQNPTAWRIGEAVGRTGHVALAGVAQNLFILWLLCKVVSPGVAAFCTFAAIALVFDFLFLLTFFVAVLSVDVRRMELSDFLNKTRQRSKVKSPGENSRLQSWGDALLRGELPVSTRIAGTVVMVSFVLLAQWHFFHNEDPTRTLSRLLRLLRADNKPQLPPVTLLSVDVNQARTPTSWLRLQDHETAREVIQVVKPNSHSYIARVYDPLVLVLEGSDRTSSHGGIRPFLPAVYDFVKHQSMVFIMSVIFIVAAVSLLMNYLLWNEDEMAGGPDEDRAEDNPLLGVKTLRKQHELDVAMIATGPEGIIVSVGLDRRILVWDLRHGANSHIVDTHNRDVSPFPVCAIAVDSSAEWLALLSASGQVMLWNITKRYWGYFTKVETKGKSTVSFSFGLKRGDAMPSLILVRSSALMTEMVFGLDKAPQATELQICKSPVICVRQFLDKCKSIASASSSLGPEP
jgi:Sterol-sensing domain of SREBP cleavage-activation